MISSLQEGMMTRITHGTPDHQALRLSRERAASTFSGYVMLIVLLLAIAGGIAGLTLFEASPLGGIAIIAASLLAFLFVSFGFYLLQPNQAAALLLFGDYKGSDRTAGLRWRWPWLTRTKISTRVHNVTSERLKVNDL